MSLWLIRQHIHCLVQSQLPSGSQILILIFCSVYISNFSGRTLTPTFCLLCEPFRKKGGMRTADRKIDASGE